MLIADANAIGDLNRSTADAKPVLDWLDRGDGMLVVGGHLSAELGRSEALMTYISGLNKLGRSRLHKLDDATVRKRTDAVKKVCRSNDPHVIAVAIISGCRLIFSKDKELGKDAHNPDILNPTASIYKKRGHSHLLKECKCKI